MNKMHPWLRGLVDGLDASNLIRLSMIPYKNRIALIILDSTLEMAFKNYIENVKKITNIPEDRWKHREQVVKIVKANIVFDDVTWQQVNYFYNLRVGLYHEDASKTVPDETIGNFQELVEFMINEFFSTKCSDLTAIPQNLIPLPLDESTFAKDIKNGSTEEIPINKIPEKINVIVVAVKETKSNNPAEINDALKRRGFRGKISNNTISIYLNQIFSYLFYKTEDAWVLSGEGEKRYAELRRTYLPQETNQDQND
jgi:hypothetical protein